jgi:hypothetical protein
MGAVPLVAHFPQDALHGETLVADRRLRRLAKEATYEVVLLAAGAVHDGDDAAREVVNGLAGVVAAPEASSAAGPMYARMPASRSSVRYQHPSMRTRLISREPR